MKSYIDKLLKNGLNNIISESVNEQLQEDDIYLHNMDLAKKIMYRIKMGEFNEEQLEAFAQYVKASSDALIRARDISYMVGVKDAILFLDAFGNGHEDWMDMIYIER